MHLVRRPVRSRSRPTICVSACSAGKKSDQARRYAALRQHADALAGLRGLEESWRRDWPRWSRNWPHCGQRAAGGEPGAVEDDPAPVASPFLRAEIKWPHMADNISLGLMTLLAAHWFATTLPTSGREVYRLVALVVTLPFGFRFERNSRSGPSGQVLAALAFGCFGTLAIGLLDIAVTGRGALPPTAQDIIASVAAIALSHFAGSALAHSRRMRAERAGNAMAAQVSGGASVANPLLHLEPARIKGTVEAVKALYDAAAPLAAGGAALWAAFGHTLF